MHLSGYGGFQVSNLAGYSAVLAGCGWPRAAPGGGQHPRRRRVRHPLARGRPARGQGADPRRLRGGRRRPRTPRRHPPRPPRGGGRLERGCSSHNMLTRYPERFGALLCTVPLIDMRRYHRLLAGASWIAEYGDPEVPADWEFLQRISAYHVDRAGKNPIRRSSSPPRAATIGSIPATPARWRPSSRRWATTPGSTSRRRAAIPTARTAPRVASFAAVGAAFLRRAIGWEPEVA